MTTAAATRPVLSDQELVELLGLIREADTVELKLAIPESHQRSAIAALGLDPLDAQIRQVFFFDTPDLTLSHHGVVVRARRVQGKGDDTVVKLRPVDPAALSPEQRESPSFGVEVDAMPGGFVCSASLKGVPKRAPVREAVAGSHPLRKVFTKEQRAFYAAHAPTEVGLDDLSVLGPIFVLKLKFAPQGFERRLVAEMWLYPDGSRVFELSTKCPPSEAFDVAAAARAFLVERGVDLMPDHGTKTRKALQFFSKELRTARTGRASGGR